jgi:hypothetical protein
MHSVDAGDFYAIKLNEEADLKGNKIIQNTKSSLLPQYGAFHTFYNFFYLAHKSFVAIYLPF